MLEEWPHPLQALTPETEKDYGARNDWKSGETFMLDYVLATASGSRRARPSAPIRTRSRRTTCK